MYFSASVWAYDLRLKLGFFRQIAE